MLAKSSCGVVLKKVPANQMERVVKRFLSYCRVSRLLLLTSIIAFGVGCYFTDTFLHRISENPEPEVRIALWGLSGFCIAFFAILDSRSRYQDYKRAKDLFFENGFHPRIAGLFIRSRCQRDAAFVAALDLGFQEPLRMFYRQQGYQWYHVIPDVVMKHPKILLSRKFWRHTLFAPTYRSRYFLG